MTDELRAAANRLVTLDNWLYNGLGNFPEGLSDSGLVSDARLIARSYLAESDERDNLLALLQEVEWEVYGQDSSEPLCPFCQNYRRENHTPDCRLAAALKGETT